jgi:alanine dehydrogenase
MPGVVARTATHAFVNAAMPYILEIVEKGIEEAMKHDLAIEVAVNTHAGKQHHMSLLSKRREVEDGLE